MGEQKKCKKAGRNKRLFTAKSRKPERRHWRRLKAHAMKRIDHDILATTGRRRDKKNWALTEREIDRLKDTIALASNELAKLR